MVWRIWSKERSLKWPSMEVLGHQNDRSSMIKVSELFNKEKLHQRCLEAAQYMRMANVDEVKDTIVNDADFYGTIYQNSDIFSILVVSVQTLRLLQR